MRIWAGASLLALAACTAAPDASPVVPISAEFGPIRASGSAARLPGGLLLTAAHVVDATALREAACRQGRPAPTRQLTGLVARINGQEVAATLLRLGQGSFDPASCDLAYQDGADLAVLRLSWPLPPAPGLPPPCQGEAALGQPVRVVTRDRSLHSQIGGTVPDPRPAHGAYDVLPVRLDAGESGGAAYDSERACLLGIVSQRDPADPGRSWLVRAPVIRAFLNGLGQDL